jgi:hypothetical protein
MPSMSALRQVASRLDCPRISDGHERTSPSASLLATNFKSAIRGLDFVIALTLCTGRESKRATNSAVSKRNARGRPRPLLLPADYIRLTASRTGSAECLPR